MASNICWIRNANMNSLKAISQRLGFVVTGRVALENQDKFHDEKQLLSFFQKNPAVLFLMGEDDDRYWKHFGVISVMQSDGFESQEDAFESGNAYGKDGYDFSTYFKGLIIVTQESVGHIMEEMLKFYKTNMEFHDWLNAQYEDVT